MSHDWSALLASAPRPEGASEAFASVKLELKAEFGAQEFKSWFEALTLAGDVDGVLYFCTPSPTARDWLVRNAQHRIEARLSSRVRLDAPIRIVTRDELPAALREQAAPASGPVAVAAPAEAVGHRTRGTFETFCEGPSNRAALLAARAVAEGDAAAFPLVLIHGPQGVGKTHLLQAIEARIRQTDPSRRVRYMMAQTFLEHFVSYVRGRGEAGDFKSLVRGNDVLLLDDIHRLAGKRATEEEFVDTIKVLTESGAHLVMTAEQGVDGLTAFEDRTRALLRGALECRVDEPDFELRRRVFTQKVQHYSVIAPGFTVPAPVSDLVAARVRGSGRDVEGAARQLLVEAGMVGREVTMELAERVLKDRFTSVEKRPTVDLIIKTTAKHFALTPQELLSRSRRRSVARPRQIAMYVCTRMTTRSLPDIGNRFGGFDHTTVLYARDRISKLAEDDQHLRSQVEAVERAVRQAT